jgi:hypothetical protein
MWSDVRNPVLFALLIGQLTFEKATYYNQSVFIYGKNNYVNAELRV